MHNYEIKPHLQKILSKLLKKDRNLYERVIRKIQEIISSDIEHYKNLSYTMKDQKRVHVGHFVLLFNFDKTNNTLSFEDFDHHDTIYRRK
mgnify:CR=1 FL=1